MVIKSKLNKATIADHFPDTLLLWEQKSSSHFQIMITAIIRKSALHLASEIIGALRPRGDLLQLFKVTNFDLKILIAFWRVMCRENQRVITRPIVLELLDHAI